MSGIAGIIHFDGRPVEPGLIEKMTGAMEHRGPDGIHHWVKGSVALGHCMLRTTPESLEEHQPLTNEDGSLALVMDGRVDNWEELRRELFGRGAVLRDRSDAELVLRAYEIWESNCLAHIDGDFALAIRDTRQQLVFCARDRVGNKPFNYYWDGKTLVFSSELHAILALPWVTEDLNNGMLAEFLAGEWYSREETFWQGISRLVAAFQMIVSASGTRVKQYWMPEFLATLGYSEDEDYIDHYRELLFDVIRRKSRTHQPVAYEVSGGLDSSAIFAMAEHMRRKQHLPAPSIQGYSLVFKDAPDANELKYSRAVGQYLDTVIFESPATEMPLSWYREWSQQYREFPGYPNGVMALGLRNAVRDRGCRVLLTGVGGDEWTGMPFTGAYYAEEMALKNWQNIYDCFSADCRDLGMGRAVWWFFRYGAAPLLPDAIKKLLRNVSGHKPHKPGWLSAELQVELEKRRKPDFDTSSINLRRRGQRNQIDILLGAYDAWARELEERLASSVGIELRSPFLSREIIQFAISTPERLRSKGLTTKWLHRKALHGILPSVVLERTDKADFMVLFQKSLDKLNDEARNNIFLRREEWVTPKIADSVYDECLSSSVSGWCEWWLWTLVGCDAIPSPHCSK